VARAVACILAGEQEVPGKQMQEVQHNFKELMQQVCIVLYTTLLQGLAHSIRC